MGRKTIALLFAVALCLAVVLPVASARSRPHGNTASAAASCSVDGNVVTATGLPVDVLLNFIVSDANGGWGRVLGFSDGAWSVSVPDRSGPTTYQFTSVTWGNNGSKFDVYARCSA